MTLKELPKYIPFFFAIALIQVYSLKTEFTPAYYNENGLLVSTAVISAVNYAKIAVP
ncbi:hypothetical protein [Crocinitomix catalasitica]|uniref:hypothetical protein n=1 Tax=Crocinitomix catalasitica TaxID=184607 RepID=UPI0012FAA61E|nr:hypothetical protein [Crocinitomix catalasitica]